MSQNNVIVPMEEEMEEEEVFDSGMPKRKAAEAGLDGYYGLLGVDEVPVKSWASSVTVLPRCLTSLNALNSLVSFYTMLAYLHICHMMPKKPRMFKETTMELSGSIKKTLKPIKWCCCGGEVSEGKPMTPEMFLKLKDTENTMTNTKTVFQCPVHYLAYGLHFARAIYDPTLGKTRDENLNIDTQYVDYEWLEKEAKIPKNVIEKFLKLKTEGSAMVSIPPAPKSKLTETEEYINPIFIFFAHSNCKKMQNKKPVSLFQNGTVNFDSQRQTPSMKDKVSFRCQIGIESDKSNPCFFAYLHPSAMAPAGSDSIYTQVMSAYVKYYFKDPGASKNGVSINAQAEGKQMLANF